MDMVMVVMDMVMVVMDMGTPTGQAIMMATGTDPMITTDIMVGQQVNTIIAMMITAIVTDQELLLHPTVK